MITPNPVSSGSLYPRKLTHLSAISNAANWAGTAKFALEVGDLATSESTTTALAPWRERRQEDRIREALGIRRGPLPNVQYPWLLHYHRYLEARLVFPFEAEYAEDLFDYRQRISSVTVVAVLDPQDSRGHEDTGLLCRVLRGSEEVEIPLVDLELPEESPNSQLLEDYWYWIWNWRFDPGI